MGEWSFNCRIKITAGSVAMVCVPAKLGYVFTVGILGCAQKSFGEVAEFPFWVQTKLHKQVCKKWQPRFIMQHTVSPQISLFIKIPCECHYLCKCIVFQIHIYCF